MRRHQFNIFDVQQVSPSDIHLCSPHLLVTDRGRVHYYMAVMNQARILSTFLLRYHYRNYWRHTLTAANSHAYLYLLCCFIYGFFSELPDLSVNVSNERIICK